MRLINSEIAILPTVILGIIYTVLLYLLWEGEKLFKDLTYL
jgi:hypothetical protein